MSWQLFQMYLVHFLWLCVSPDYSNPNVTHALACLAFSMGHEAVLQATLGTSNLGQQATLGCTCNGHMACSQAAAGPLCHTSPWVRSPAFPAGTKAAGEQGINTKP